MRHTEVTYKAALPAGNFMVMANTSPFGAAVQVAWLDSKSGRALALNKELVRDMPEGSIVDEDHRTFWTEDGYGVGIDQAEMTGHTVSIQNVMHALIEGAAIQVCHLSATESI